MKRYWMPILLALTAVVTIVTIVRTASAGPPLICFPIDIGDAESLPWGDDAFEFASGYDRADVIDDTLDLLELDSPILVRMETLRRATLYLERDRELSLMLLTRLMSRALESEADETPHALAWFDAGYYAQCREQMRLSDDWATGSRLGVAGLRWVERAAQLREVTDADIAFAIAKMTQFPAMFEKYGSADGRATARDRAEAVKIYRANLRLAHKLAGPDSIVATNIESNFLDVKEVLAGGERP